MDLLTISANLMATDSELCTLMCAMDSRQQGTHGFQGCKNYGHGCDYGGFYLASYSGEGLCGDCELKQFPHRFRGCPFCGRAIRYSTFCWECSHSFSEWLFNVFYSKNPNSESSIKIGIYGLVNRSTHKVPVRYMKRGRLPRFDNSDQWKGFHAGDEQYTWIDPFEFKKHVDISDITWDNKEDVLLRELEKNDIHIYEEIQI